MLDPEVGFTAGVIRDPRRFVGRTELLSDCMKALNTPLGLIAVYGKRGVGKSSLIRQLQNMALGNYDIAEEAGLRRYIPDRPRTYLTVYYQCDAMIGNAEALLTRLCNDQDQEDGLLRLVPNDGKELIEFTRTKEVSGGADLKVVNWGTKGVESSKFARIVPGDAVQTFRNFVSAVVSHQVQKRMKRDSLLIIIDEFDVIRDKSGVGSIVKSLSSETVKFAVSGVADDLIDLVHDHGSVERLLEEGALHLQTMSRTESVGIIRRAESLFKNQISFAKGIAERIADLSEGYPYLTQLFGKECVEAANRLDTTDVDGGVLDHVLDRIRSGRAFPTLENAYQRAIGESKDRAILLHLLAEHKENESIHDEGRGLVSLKSVRGDAEYFDVSHVDQLIPRLVDGKFGPVLRKIGDRRGTYEFDNPIMRVYIKLRALE